MADYFTLFSVLFPVGTADNVRPALDLYQQFADELEKASEAIGFVLRCAEAFDLQGLWGFRWALTCSKPRLDGLWRWRAAARPGWAPQPGLDGRGTLAS